MADITQNAYCIYWRMCNPAFGYIVRLCIENRNLISQFAENRIVLLATHIVPDVEAIANEVLILKEGMLIKQNTPERLTGDLYGKVWELTLSAEQKLPDVDYFQISNIQSIGDRLRIRLLAEKKPAENAERVAAGLEDVFLYYFGLPEVEA